MTQSSSRATRIMTGCCGVQVQLLKRHETAGELLEEIQADVEKVQHF